MTIRALGLAALGVMLTAAIGAGYQAAPLPVSISGLVVDGVTGAPVAGADVILNQLVQRGIALHGDGPKTSGLTDAAGRFTITGTPLGRLRMHVTKEGYLEGFPDQLGPSDLTGSGGLWFLEVTPGEQVKDITVKLWRTSTIKGVVEDEAHDPLVGESVVLLERRHWGEGVRFSYGDSPAQTDDRGRFQFTNVRPGEYYLLVPPPQPSGAPGASRLRPHPGVYYPGALRLNDASVVRVGGGDMLDGLNVPVKMDAAQRARRVAGQLVGPAGRIDSMSLALVDADAPRELARIAALRARASHDGTFSFAAVMPGRYRIVANDVPTAHVQAARFPAASLPDDPVLWADELVVVDARDVTDLLVPLKTGGRIRGRLVFDSGKPAPTADELREMGIRFLSRDRGGLSVSAPFARVDANGSFVSVPLSPGFYSIFWERPAALQGWQPPVIRVGGGEMSVPVVEVGADDLDVEVRILSRPTTVAGSVSDVQGRPVTQARVIMFPRDPSRWVGAREQWPVLAVSINSKGRFSQSYFPGDYLVAAVSSVPANWSAPEFLETLAPRATRATVTAGETVELSLRVEATP